ncbi:MAG: hypothetical protein GX639_12795 [Fibrobacter sp.]|nr:hypothetical protein [Fibrobacter sp.]
MNTRYRSPIHNDHRRIISYFINIPKPDTLLRLCLVILPVLLLCHTLRAELPPALPGEEITDHVLRKTLVQDTIRKGAKDTLRSVTLWYDKAASTWDAPSLTDQMSKDNTIVPMGKGGIFIPRMTQLHKEPDIEILDSMGVSVGGGETGVTYPLEPGSYYVMLGSGTHKQRIVRKVEVVEFRTMPVIPHWAGLIIETIDTNAASIKGEYELVRIDGFESFGRGYGADVSLGETVKTWILKPGLYKILGRGESYNTLKNFITVRLMPGELSRIVLIQRPEDLVILGGGNVDVASGRKITSNWKFGGSVGGNIQFVNNVDKKDDRKSDYSSLLNLNSSTWIRYHKNPLEWETTISLNEGFNVVKQASSSSSWSIMSATDDFKVRTLFIWRFFQWLGPYGSVEAKTNLLTKDIRRGDKELFLILTDDSVRTTTEIDSSAVHRLNPSFSPVTFDVGGGVNIDALNLNLMDIAIRLGAGSSYSGFPEKYTEISGSKINYDTSDRAVARLIDKSVLLRYEKKTEIFELGPLGQISANLRVGRFGTAGAELKVFVPLYPENRLTKPDFNINTILSWQIARGVTLDYEFSYVLKQPTNKDAVVDLATNTVLLRFSFSSR